MTWWCSSWHFHFTPRSESLFSWHGAFLCGVCGFSPGTPAPAHIPKTIPSLTGWSESFRWVQMVVMLAEELRHTMAYLENSNFVFTEDGREAASVEVSLAIHPHVSVVYPGKSAVTQRYPTPPLPLAVTLCGLWHHLHEIVNSSIFCICLGIWSLGAEHEIHPRVTVPSRCNIDSHSGAIYWVFSFPLSHCYSSQLTVWMIEVHFTHHGRPVAVWKDFFVSAQDDDIRGAENQSLSSRLFTCWAALTRSQSLSYVKFANAQFP